VLPVAIPQRTWIELRKQPGSRVTGMDTAAGFTLGEEASRSVWWDYVQGATWVLARDGLRAGGCTLRIRSDVPLGAGLSSTAALCVALLRVLRQAFGLSLDDVTVALLAQKVETNFVGAPVGVMDQMASSLADDRTALFLDSSNERVPVRKAL